MVVLCRDEDDGVLVEKEGEAEKQAIEQAVQDFRVRPAILSILKAWAMGQVSLALPP